MRALPPLLCALSVRLWRGRSLPWRCAVGAGLGAAGLCLAGFVAWLVLGLVAPPPLLQGVSLSAVLLDGEGRLARLGLSSDEKYRIFTPLHEISPVSVQAALLYEDRYFYNHCGINPLSLARAALSMIGGGRKLGGSTITMQVARLRLHLDTAHLGGKLRQMWYALLYERHYSKADLLEAYFTLAPYGGNIEGVGAAARVYFQVDAGRLSTGQALALTAVPQNPVRRSPLGGPDFHAARARVHTLWAAATGETRLARPQPVQVHGVRELPFAVPHLAAELLGGDGASLPSTPLPSAAAGARPPIRLFINPTLQGALEGVLRGFAARNAAYGINNAAALVLHWPDMRVRALAGSADFHNQRISGQVDGTRARRSPGSVLKPFIYALALQQGLIHPRTLLPDFPRSFAGYAPENFDQAFRGPVPADEALRASRNVPAVWLASRIQPDLWSFLQRAGANFPKDANYYGLAMVLGGAEVSMRQVAEWYAMLANGGVWRNLLLFEGQEVQAGVPLLAPEVAHVTLRMLEDSSRRLSVPGGGYLPLRLKTGTSNGFRDAWTAGVVGQYVLVVWVGNFDNASNNLLIGGSVAEPLFEDMARQLARHGRDGGGLRDPIPAQANTLPVSRVRVCADTGDLDTSLCPASVETWFLPGRSPTADSGIYRSILVDEATGLRLCAPGAQGARREVHQFWPSDMRALYARAGIVKPVPPPYAPECAELAPHGKPPRILSPVEGVDYVRRLSDPARSSVPLKAAVDADARTVFWFNGTRSLGSTRAGEVLLWHPQDGRHNLRVIDDQGRAAEQLVRVRTIP